MDSQGNILPWLCVWELLALVLVWLTHSVAGCFLCEKGVGTCCLSSGRLLYAVWSSLCFGTCLVARKCVVGGGTCCLRSGCLPFAVLPSHPYSFESLNITPLVPLQTASHCLGLSVCVCVCVSVCFCVSVSSGVNFNAWIGEQFVEGVCL